MSDADDRTTGQKPYRPDFNMMLSACTVLFGLLILVLIPSQVDRPPKLFGRDSDGLDPAVFPALVGVGFVLMGLLYLVQCKGIREHNQFRDLNREAWVNLAVTMSVGIIYVLILVPLGFVAASALTVGTLSIYYGARHWLGILLVAVGIPSIVFYIFTKVLLVSLPEFPGF